MEQDLWATIDTRVRKLIKSIMEPGLIRIQAAEENSKKLLEYKQIFRGKLKRLKSKVILIEEKMPSNEKLNKSLMDHSIQLNYIEVETKKDAQLIRQSIEKLEENILNLNEQIPSVLNQMDFTRGELNTAKKDFLRIRNSIENTFKLNFDEFVSRTNESAEASEKLQYNFISVQKKVDMLAKALSQLEVKEVVNWKNCFGRQEQVESDLNGLRNQQGGMLEDVKKFKNDIFDWKKKLDSEIIKEIVEAKEGLEETQDVIIAKWFDYVLTDPKYKKRLAEFKSKSKAFTSKPKEKPKAAKNLTEETVKLVKTRAKSQCFNQVKSSWENLKSLTKIVSVQALKIEEKQEPKKKEKKIYNKSYKLISSSLPPAIALEEFLNKSVESQKIIAKSLKLPGSWLANMKMRRLSTVSPPHRLSLLLKKIPKNLLNTSMESNNQEKLSEDLDQSIEILTESQLLEKTSSITQPDLIEHLENQIETLQNQFFILNNDVHQGVYGRIDDLSQQVQKLNDSNTESIITMQHGIEETLKPWVLSSLSASINDAISQLLHKTELTTKRLSERCEILDFDLQQSIKEFNSYVLIKRREISDLTDMVKRHHRRIEENNESIDELEYNFANIAMCCDKLKDNMVAINALLKQDEIDRKTLSLMAFKSHKDVPRRKRNNVSPVGLDKNCVSCANNVAQVLPAFKVACLAYNSSPVKVNDRVASRIEILDDQFEVLASMPRSMTPINNRILTPELPKIKVKLK